MKKITIIFSALTMVMSMMIFTSCKKDKKDDVTVAQKTKPNDSQGSSEADEAMSNVNDFINNKVGGGSGAGQKVSAYNLPCGVVRVDSTSNGNGTYTYTMKYGNQTTCGYKKKSGDVIFALTNGTAFNQAGAVYSVTFVNYAVEILATGQIVTLNGTTYITNVNGGFVWETVVNSLTVIHKVRGSYTVTYSDSVNTQRSRSYFQLRTYTSSNGWAGLTLTVNGDTTINSKTVSEIGRTYEGDLYFETQILENFVWANCGSTWAGPYVLKSAHARMDITHPSISPTYMDVEGGYNWEYEKIGSTPVKVNDCSTNAYKVTTVIGTATASVYQLY